MNNHWRETLAELERIREEAGQGISIIKKLMALPPTNTAVDHTFSKVQQLPAEDYSTPTGTGADSLAQQLRELFQQNSNRSFAVADVARALGDVSEKSISGGFARLFKIKFIQRVSRGRYKLHRQQLPEAHPE